MASRAGDKDAKKGKNIHVKNIGIGSLIAHKENPFFSLQIFFLTYEGKSKVLFGVFSGSYLLSQPHYAFRIK